MSTVHPALHSVNILHLHVDDVRPPHAGRALYDDDGYGGAWQVCWCPAGRVVLVPLLLLLIGS